MTSAMKDWNVVLWDALAAGLEAAWNAGDGHGFAAYFTEDADFVNIYGYYGKGRTAIALAHNAILNTVYRGSTVHMNVVQARLLTEDVAVIHLNSHLRIPQGPMAGEGHAAPSAVLVRGADGWKIAAFHNTLVKEPPAAHNNGQTQ